MQPYIRVLSHENNWICIEAQLRFRKTRANKNDQLQHKRKGAEGVLGVGPNPSISNKKTGDTEEKIVKEQDGETDLSKDKKTMIKQYVIYQNEMKADDNLKKDTSSIISDSKCTILNTTNSECILKKW